MSLQCGSSCSGILQLWMCAVIPSDYDGQQRDLGSSVHFADPSSLQVNVRECFCLIQGGSQWSSRSFKPPEASLRKRGGSRKESMGRQCVPFCEMSVPRLKSSAESSSRRLREAVGHWRDCGATASVNGQVKSLFKVSRDTKVCPTAYLSLLDHRCCNLVQVQPIVALSVWIEVRAPGTEH